MGELLLCGVTPLQLWVLREPGQPAPRWGSGVQGFIQGEEEGRDNSGAEVALQMPSAGSDRFKLWRF